jgi:site-specific DNA recombinase
MKKAVAYLRVSTKAQEVEGYSIEVQRTSLQKFAKRNGFTIVQEFVGIESAKEPGRPQFNAMIQFIKKDRTIKHILVDGMDRLSRNLPDFFAIDQLIKEKDITLHIAKDNGTYSKDSSPWEENSEYQKVLAARLDNRIRAAKVKQAMLQKAEGGRYPSRAPFGYKNCEKYGKRDVAPDPETAPYVVRMFELYATGNYSVVTLRDEMVSKGMVYRNGKPPHHSEIAKILKSRFYLGEFMWKGKLYKGASHKAIISEELFERVQKLMTKPGKQKSRKGLFPYTGSIVCGTCGYGVTAEIKKELYIYYSAPL